jgi:hypothetical protein
MSTTSSLVYKDLRGYLDAVDKLGEMRIVNGRIDLKSVPSPVAARAVNPKVVLFIIKTTPKDFAS